MFCVKCGSKAVAGAAFCFSCGVQLPSANTSEVVPVVASETKDAVIETKSNILEPWFRYIARLIDFSWFSTVVLVLARLVAADRVARFDPAGAQVLLTIVTLWLWCIVEPIFLSRGGESPGKWVCGIRLVPVGTWAPGFETYFERSARVLGRGLFLGVPALSLLAMGQAFFRLRKCGRTWWDEALNIDVECRYTGLGRLILAVAVFIALVSVHVIVVGVGV